MIGEDVDFEFEDDAKRDYFKSTELDMDLPDEPVESVLLENRIEKPDRTDTMVFGLGLEFR